ncbi:MAG: exosortase-associated EpsI family protein [Phycisphaera sp.]|nr:exosortase-associated EpsI family protein [Phycisphaera sp.]
MQVERSAIQAYVAAIAVLVLGAVGFRMLVAELNIHLMKERVELRRPLDTIPTKLGRWERIGSDSVFSDTLIEELGTRSYLDRAYAIDGDPAKGYVHVHIAYYTGTIDAVPHIPERCWAVGGLELTRNSEGVALDIDRSEWRPYEGPAKVDQPYLVAEVRDPITADIEWITMPLGEIAATTIEFQDPKKPEDRQVGGYFFIANGRAVPSSYGVRQAAFNLRDRYAYYCKIQLTKRGKVDKPDGSLLEPFKADAAEILDELIPHVMRSLPDWPTYEELSRGEKSRDAE